MQTRKILAIIVTVILLALTAVVVDTDNTVRLHQVEMNTKAQEIKALETKLYENQSELEKAKGDQQKLDKVLEDNKQLQEQIKALQARKAEQQRLAQERARNAVVAAEMPSGSCAEWIAAAGVSDVANAAELIRRESGCNPNAVNSSSGACGIPQALPCSKLGTSDPVQQIIWMQNYVMGRYGSWAAAVAFHNQNGWY